MDRGFRIHGVGLILPLFLLLWLERILGGFGDVSRNKVAALGAARPWICCKEEGLLTGRGGEEERRFGAARCSATSFLAGRGGEEERRSCAPLLDLGRKSCYLCRSCFEQRSPRSLPSLACRGGEEGGGGGATSCCLDLHRHLPKRCYGAEFVSLLRAEHAASSIDVVIFGRQGGPISTSFVEASLRICLWSSTSLRCQVVRPRQLRSGQGSWFSAGNGCSSSLPLLLGGNALRTPVMWRRHLRTGLHSLLLFQGVVCKDEGPYCNFSFLSAIVVKGPLCKLYLPRG